jgi:hypothetical protein
VIAFTSERADIGRFQLSPFWKEMFARQGVGLFPRFIFSLGVQLDVSVRQFLEGAGVSLAVRSACGSFPSAT